MPDNEETIFDPFVGNNDKESSEGNESGKSNNSDTGLRRQRTRATTLRQWMEDDDVHKDPHPKENISRKPGDAASPHDHEVSSTTGREDVSSRGNSPPINIDRFDFGFGNMDDIIAN